jgi:hypothetical protein
LAQNHITIGSIIRPYNITAMLTGDGFLAIAVGAKVYTAEISHIIFIAGITAMAAN